MINERRVMGGEGAELWNPVSDILTIPMREDKMEVIDRKFKFTAVSNKSGKKYTEKNAIVFLLKDALLPDLLDKYYDLAVNKMADERQLEGIRLLKDRVLTWQRNNINKVHVPDVEVGKEEKRVCKPNK
jgi:hypothetical protein